MKWFKHDSDANQDAKLKKLRLKYGAQGYGIYWYCLELIARNVEKHNLTFELEHDAELIAHDFSLSSELVQDMMTYMVDLDLFENNRGAITCLKMSKRTDEYTQKVLKSMDNIGIVSGDNPKKSELREEKRREENRREENINSRASSDNTPKNYSYSEIIDYLNTRAGTQYKASTKKTQQLINARYQDGCTLEDFKKCIDNKVNEWVDDPEFSKYLRPETLFGTKMESYYNCNTPPASQKNMSKLERELYLINNTEPLINHQR